MIRDTAAAFLAEVSDSDAVRRAMVTERGFEEPVWRRICSDMYWPALHIPEQYGGMGLGYVELVAILEQMGRYLLCAPFYSSVCLATNALLVAANDQQKAHYLPQFAEGGLTGTLAYTGVNRCWDAAAVQTIARRDGENYVLNGTLRYVPDGHSAGLLVVAAREAGSVGEHGISLFLVAADSAGVERQCLPTMDQTRKQASVVLRDVPVAASARMGDEAEAWPQLQKIIELASVAIAA